MLLIFTENKVTDRMLSWDKSKSCGWESENVDTNRTLKYLSFKTLSIKLGRPKTWRSFIIPYFHVVSYIAYNVVYIVNYRGGGGPETPYKSLCIEVDDDNVLKNASSILACD